MAEKQPQQPIVDRKGKGKPKESLGLAESDQEDFPETSGSDQDSNSETSSEDASEDDLDDELAGLCEEAAEHGPADYALGLRSGRSKNRVAVISRDVKHVDGQGSSGTRIEDGRSEVVDGKDGGKDERKRTLEVISVPAIKKPKS